MQAIPEEIPFTEHFSFAEITWKIQNISIALCPLTHNILSEEFQITGREDTLWRLNLKISHERNVAALCLKMLGPDRKFYSLKCREAGLMVNCFANILDSNGEQSLKSERTIPFSFRETKEIETFDLSDIVLNLPHLGPDELTIRCHLLIDHGERVNVVPHIADGIIELSNTMERLFNNSIYYDIDVYVNNKKFNLHKEMLSNIHAMGRFMWEKFKETRLLNHCEFSLGCIFGYAYSGNINHIIGAPRIRVAEDIERLVVPELFGAYPKEKISLETTIRVKEFTCVWKIEDFELIENSLSGPVFNVDETNSRWKICMHPKGKVNCSVDEKKYVFLEATLLESTRASIDVNIQFCSLNENEVLYSRRDHKRMNVGDKLEIPYFLRGGQLMRKCLIEKNLSLRITLWISTGQIATHIGDIIQSPPFIWHNAQTLTFFSRKMRKILADEQNWDLGLVSGNNLFKVHKFVLASRCSYFKNRISNLHRQVIPLPEFKRHYIRVFLENIYSGLFCDMEFDATFHMYEFGFMFDLKHLQLRFDHQVEFFNLLSVFEYAMKNNLLHLRNETLKYIISVGDAITEHPDWEEFFNTQSSVAFQIIGSWK